MYALADVFILAELVIAISDMTLNQRFCDSNHLPKDPAIVNQNLPRRRLMPRPRPLVNLSSAVPLEQHQLTPRTPRTASGSRTSRLEQGFAKVQLSDVNEADFDDDDRGALQSAPLLASSSTARFSSHIPRSRPSPIDAKDGKKRKTISASHMLSSLPLAVGIFIAGILLILIVLSLTRPEDLHRYIGTKPPNADLPSNAIPSSGMSSAKPDTGHETEGLHLISYDNYTTFPLQPIDYLRECAKMHQGYMKHGDYWDISFMGAMDVHHADDPAICSRTITYMLDGIVGLTADLALMAQAAALAREVCKVLVISSVVLTSKSEIGHFSSTTLIGIEESSYELKILPFTTVYTGIQMDRPLRRCKQTTTWSSAGLQTTSIKW